MIIAPNPGNVTTGIICVTVNEYRNGVQIGSITRDMQVTALLCPGNNQLPKIDSITLVSGGTQVGTHHYQLCGNDTLVLDVAGSDADITQTLGVGTSSSIPGLSINSSSANPVTGTLSLTATQLGTYYIPVMVEDNKCPIPGRAFVWVQVDITSNCLSAVVTGSPCGQTVGAIDLTVNGTGGPLTFLWSNGATTEDISGLAPGSYTVTVTDSLGGTQTGTYHVNSTTITIGETITQPTCSNANGGAVTTAPSGGVAPYSYLWNTGATTSSISNLPAGGYSVTVTDVNGCPRHAAFIVDPPDSCFNIIEGVVFEDINGNCVQDAGELPIPGAMIDISPGGAVMTDANGFYQYIVNQGSFSVALLPNIWQQVTCPSSGAIPVTFTNLGNKQSNSDFAIQTTFFQDLSVHTFSSPARPGFASSHSITVFNHGSDPMSGPLTWEHDGIFQYQSASPAPWSYQAASKTVTWNFLNLLPFQSKTYVFYTQTDTSVAVGASFLNEAIVNPIQGDSLPGNNVSIYQNSTVASFDPNDKLVTPVGDGPLGLIEQSQDRLTYTVRFQNTGTDTAFYVVIRDTLDTHLKPLSFQKMGESHPYQLTIEDDHILVFRFNRIDLPDSTTNLLASQGYVAFSLKVGEMLSPGTQIRNDAAIFFDFNAPIITNETLNTIFTYPEVDLGSDLQICAGDSIQAMVTSAGLPPYDFQWSHGVLDNMNGTGVSQAAITSTGSYFVTVTDSLGITATSPPINVGVTQLPTASFTFSAVGLRVAFINTGSFSPGLQWDFGDGDTLAGALSHIHTYEKSELYTVTLIVTNDCGSDTITQQIDLRGVGIADDLFGRSVQLVPHPVRDVSYLRFANVERAAYRLRILDLQGRIVKEMPETRGEVFEISRDEFASGLYLYELTGRHSHFGKMVVK